MGITCPCASPTTKDARLQSALLTLVPTAPLRSRGRTTRVVSPLAARYGQFSKFASPPNHCVPSLLVSPTSTETRPTPRTAALASTALLRPALLPVSPTTRTSRTLARGRTCMLTTSPPAPLSSPAPLPRRLTVSCSEHFLFNHC